MTVMHMTNQQILDNGYKYGIRHFPPENAGDSVVYS